MAWYAAITRQPAAIKADADATAGHLAIDTDYYRCFFAAIFSLYWCHYSCRHYAAATATIASLLPLYFTLLLPLRHYYYISFLRFDYAIITLAITPHYDD